MKTHNLIASTVAILLTTASLALVSYNVDSQQASASQQGSVHATTLPLIQVHPSAAEMRAAALLSDNGTAATIALPSPGSIAGSATSQRVALLGSQLVMPYYSFGNKFGSASKE